MDQEVRWTRQFAARMVRVLVLSGMSIPINQIPVRASALTYTTILSFVPLAVILSAVAGHFGYLGLLSKSVITLSDSMNLDIDLDPILNLINQVQSVDFHRLGLVGSLGLLVTFFLSMSNIELAMDQIWDIHKKRNWWTRIKEFTPFLIIHARDLAWPRRLAVIGFIFEFQGRGFILGFPVAAPCFYWQSRYFFHTPFNMVNATSRHRIIVFNVCGLSVSETSHERGTG